MQKFKNENRKRKKFVEEINFISRIFKFQPSFLDISSSPAMNGSNSTEMDVDSTMMPPTIYYSLPPMPWFGMDIGKNKIPKKPHEISFFMQKS